MMCDSCTDKRKVLKDGRRSCSDVWFGDSGTDGGRTEDVKVFIGSEQSGSELRFGDKGRAMRWFKHVQRRDSGCIGH